MLPATKSIPKEMLRDQVPKIFEVVARDLGPRIDHEIARMLPR